MSFPRYPKYKASGVEWLGEVPAHWDIVRLARLSTSRCDGPFGSGLKSEHYTEEGVRVVRLQNIKVGGFDGSDAAFVSAEYVARELSGHDVLHGDLLVAGLGDDNNRVGRACVAPASIGPTIVKADCFRFRIDDRRCRAQFAAYSLNASVVADSGRLATGSTRSRIPLSAMGSRCLALPPLEEQDRVVAFLELESTKIDALVAEQQRLIELLKEKRQAVISHAVTKGLDPNAKLKPSGIEWLGDVPAHWRVVSIKWLSPVRRGASPRPIDDAIYFDDVGEYAWVRIADVSASVSGRLHETPQRLSELGSSLSVRLEPGSLFVSIAGTVGKPCITETKACIHDGFVWFPALELDPRFLFRIFEAEVCYGGLGKLGTQLNLNTDTIGSIRIAAPPANEIREVCDFIDAQMDRLGGFVDEAERTIALLQERRTALISAAVTGQIDVRSIGSKGRH